MNGEADCPTDLEMAAPKGQDRWSQEDMLTLLECMKNNIPSNGSSKFKTTESHMDWEKVAFKDFSGDMCKLKWVEISNEVRKFRTLTELILDAQEHVKNPYKGKKLKKHPDFPKKPLTPYFRFFMEKRAAGYDSGNGDWWYATVDGKGKILNAGKVQSCIECHANADNDYVFGTPK